MEKLHRGLFFPFFFFFYQQKKLKQINNDKRKKKTAYFIISMKKLMIGDKLISTFTTNLIMYYTISQLLRQGKDLVGD